MAAVSSVTEIVEYHDGVLTPVKEAPPPSPVVREDVMYVAVGNMVKESELTLLWALKNSGGRRLCIIHVHQPAKKIPIMGTKFPITKLAEHQVRAYHDAERQNMRKVLEKYTLICEQSGMPAEKLVIEMDSIEKGIIELIHQHGIGKLVIGGAANRSYSRRMIEPKSKKAIYVCQHAPAFCHIWFVCKGHLIHTRESRIDALNMEVSSPAPVGTPSPASGSPSRGLSGTVQTGPLAYSTPEKGSVGSTDYGLTPYCRSITDGSSDGWGGMSMRSSSGGSRLSSCSSSEMLDDSSLVSPLETEGSESRIQAQADPFKYDPSPLPSISESSGVDELYDRLQQFVVDAETSRREAYEESIKRRKAEKEAIDAFLRVKASEFMYAEELRKRRETEEALAEGDEEVKRMRQHLKKIMEDLRVSQEEKSCLECQIADSGQMVHELEDKILSAVDLIQKFKKEKDELEVERDDALRIAEGLRQKHVGGPSSRPNYRFFAEFSFSEIKEATNNFDPSLIIGEGGYGSIYKGLLRHTQVAIKMLNSNSSQGPSEFLQEVNILSKLRHPNLVTLIGACPEAWTLVYEYLPNGSLEDRINPKDNTPPLTWQTRIRIAAELCSVLLFLHSYRPQGIIHGDLKPANILLDANHVSKLSDFGICCELSEDDFPGNNKTLSCRTNARGTFAYMDPEVFATGELTAKSDVFSFGIILQRLLTGKPALGITREVQYALDQGNLKDLLDPAAGDWPFVQAKQLAHLAMSCCRMDGINRPDLACEVLRVLEPMRASCGVSSSHLGFEEGFQIPSHFICPIFQEIMQDPVVAADGYTYEAEALKGWLDSGHNTSPMTNLKLAHSDLVPNHTLRSAIQEWLQQP
ncbi:hypothetical protein LIER_11793 [Lithospermum erythrorhizon]|uniref:RING-type E3 ubiquitin transferase n=1 Tax=Lithospermum erythrorhizon TaxID=34254 RepID=A0AAV3PPE1_LITER